MKGEIIIGRDSSIVVRTMDGTFADGSTVIAALVAAMQARGVVFDTAPIPEQHRHDDADHTHEDADHTHE